MKRCRLAAVVPLGLILIALAACDFAYPAVEGKFERTLTVSGPVSLDVSTGSGRIAVRAGSASAVQIFGEIRARDDWKNNAQEKVRYLMENPPIEQTGNVIRIGRIENSTYRNNVSISYEIIVPAETTVRSSTGSGSQNIEGIRGAVNASTGSGSITMADIGSGVVAHTGSGGIRLDQIAGTVEAQTGSGSIHALGISGSIKAATGSGGITLEQVAAEHGGALDVEAGTGSGSIVVSGVNGSLRAESGSGGIRASGIPAGDWTIDASSGSVTLNLGSGAAFDLYARSSSGQITTDLPITVTGTIGKHEMRGKVRGGGRLIEVTTHSGGITIR